MFPHIKTLRQIPFAVSFQKEAALQKIMYQSEKTAS